MRLARQGYPIESLEARQLSQAEAAKVLGLTQPKIPALRHYKLAGFSIERLLNLLTVLDQDVEIVIRRRARLRKAGRLSVVAAIVAASVLTGCSLDGEPSERLQCEDRRVAGDRSLLVLACGKWWSSAKALSMHSPDARAPEDETEQSGPQQARES